MASPPASLSRRTFLGSCCAAVGTTGMLSALAQLRLIGAAADPGYSPSAAGDSTAYKALVCLFLAGGNDANNLIVPSDAAGHAAYAAARGALALPRSSLLGLSPLNSGGRAWGLHPSLAQVGELFAGGRVAVLANVGTLVVPTTRTQYNLRAVPLPPQLFSHNDQQVQWQSSVPDKPFSTGWGGRLADLTNAFNDNPTISMSISLAGQNSFQVGRTIAQYSVDRTGVVRLSGTSTDSPASAGGVRLGAIRDLVAPGDAGLFEAAFAGMTAGAIEDSALLSGVLGTVLPFPDVFPNSNLGQQLRMIARLIHAAPGLGHRRQVFFARIGGWDLHDNQVAAGLTTAGAHGDLLADVSASLKAFHDTTAQLGLADAVTTFTASDFGRTYNTNGDGSDHGWGSHHLVMGGAVKGRDVYGAMPVLSINGPDDTGRGRWIPTTSVDEYSATLARWFGVSESNLPLVLPNIGRFARRDLGFMR